MTMSKEIGMRIKIIRVESGMKQVHLGRALELDQATISKMELGETDPTTRTLIKLRDIFQVTIDWILTGEGGRNILAGTDREIAQMLEDCRMVDGLRIRILSCYYDYKVKNLEKFIIKKAPMVRKGEKG
jgi:transcriptional regulator with XRE-family HTH domain